MKSKFFAHPAALVDDATIGEGTRVWAFAHVLSGARIGRNCNIGDHCFVEGGACIGNGVTIKNGVEVWEGVEIRDGVFVGPNVVFTNDRTPRSPRAAVAAVRYQNKDWLERTVVEEGASLGANSTILCGLRIGKSAMVAAGAVVTRDVPAHGLVAGVPARMTGWVCACGARVQPDAKRMADCKECGTRFRVKDWRLLAPAAA
jgi:acetyltransferase-like isoleucine patch superfamily enzyme